MFNLIEYSNNYLKLSGSLWQYYRDDPALNDEGTLANFPGSSASLKSCSNNGTIEIFK